MIKKPYENTKGAFTTGLLVLVVCLVFLVLLVAPLNVSLLIIAVGLLALVFLEKKKYIEDIYRLFDDHRHVAYWIMALFGLLLPVMLRNNSYLLHVAVMSGIYGIVAIGLNFQVGSTGMVNFAPAALFGMGAYASAFLTVKLGVSPWFGTLGGLVTATILGVMIGFPALKTKGYYLSLVTIALQVMFTLWIINSPWLGGPNGIPGVPPYQIAGYSLKKSLTLFGLQMPYQANYFYLTVALLILFAMTASRIYNSRVGLAWNAIEQDEVVAQCQGINLTTAKLLAFCLGAAFAGTAGALYGHYTSFVGVDDFDFSKSLILICMVILGGMDNVSGAVLGSLVLTIIDEKLRDFADYRMLMYGLILIVILLVRSQGLLPRRPRKYELKESGTHVMMEGAQTWKY
ncbi:hypothetical protein SY88_04835 [Clostridiales bacterium PH28_bin88]|nr:hypothetical protein SY88_04835 [Clostridiales bacterium PH28_bin88]